MSKFCPITGGKVVYLVCQECENRVCEKKNEPTIAILPKKEKPVDPIPEPRKSTSNTNEMYYLIQSYRKDVDEEYQRHLYPSYLACFKLDGIGLMLQSGQNDAIKCTSMEIAKTWLERAKKTFPNHDLQIVPFDARIFGRATHRFVVDFEIPAIVNHPSCSSCCNCNGTHVTTLFGKQFEAIECPLYPNHVFGDGDVQRRGCEYHNRDMNQEEICMNCESFLGGGDWGLACAADYHALPNATTKACSSFKRKTKDE